MIASLPSIIWDYLISGGDDPAFSTANAASVVVAYDELTDDVTALVDTGYNQALASVETIIQNGGYDYDLSMQALINYAQSSAGYDVSYILAAYSASLQQQNNADVYSFYLGLQYTYQEISALYFATQFFEHSSIVSAYR